MPPALPRTAVIDRVKLAGLRAAFGLGGRLAPGRTVAAAATLFATPLSSSRTRAQAARPDAAMRREDVAVGGLRIATYVWGDPSREPYALLAHGWSSFGLRFLPWVPRLRALGYAVVTFDQPGHGHSEGERCTLPDFIATLRAVGQRHGEAALAIAHSLGGAATALAQGGDWRARRLALVAPAIDMRDAVRRFFRFVGVPERLREPFLAELRRRTGIHVDELRVEPKLRALAQPALIVHDRDDADVPWTEGERYARHWPGARLILTQGLGHREILEAPGVVEAILAFARGETVGEHAEAGAGGAS